MHPPIRQAIQTRYHGPTDHRGSRVIASCQAKRITLDWDHALDTDQNHLAAAVALIEQLSWPGVLTGGVLADGSYAWVFTP